MVTSFIQDLNTLAGSVAGAAQSITGLYQTRVKLETDRLRSLIRQSDDAFMARTFLQDGDSNKIDFRNWRDELARHREAQEAILSDVRWERVAGTVRSELNPEVSGFNLKFGQVMYQAERQYNQGLQYSKWQDMARRGDVEGLRASRDSALALFDDQYKADQAYNAALSAAGATYLQAETSTQKFMASVPEGETLFHAMYDYAEKADVPADSKRSFIVALQQRRKQSTEEFDSFRKEAFSTENVANGTVPLERIQGLASQAIREGFVDNDSVMLMRASYSGYVVSKLTAEFDNLEAEFKSAVDKDPDMASKALAERYISRGQALIDTFYAADSDKPLSLRGSSRANQALKDYIDGIRNYLRVDDRDGAGSAAELTSIGLMLDVGNLSALVDAKSIGEAQGIMGLYSYLSEADRMARQALASGDAKTATSMRKAHEDIRALINKWTTSGGAKTAWLLQLSENDTQNLLKTTEAMLMQERMIDTSYGKAIS